MTIKKFVVCSWFIFALLSGQAFAQGVPTVSVAELIQMAQQLAVLKDQFDVAKDQLNSMRDLKTSFSGARGLGNIFNDASIQSSLPKEWKSVLGAVKGTAEFLSERGKFPTLPNNPKLNGLFDSIASQNATMTVYFKQANDRLAQVEKLRGQIDSTDDPAAKDDLRARLISEQNAIQGTTQLIGIIQAKMKQEHEAANRGAEREIHCKEFKKDCS